MSPRHRTRTRLYAAATLALAAAGSPLFAANYYFVGPSGAAFSDPANWSTSPAGPGGTPPTDSDFFGIDFVTPTSPSTFTLLLDASPNGVTLGNVLFSGANVTGGPLVVDVPAPTGTIQTRSISVGPNVTFNQAGGELRASGNTITFSGATTTYSLSGTGSLYASTVQFSDGVAATQSGGFVSAATKLTLGGGSHAVSYALSGGNFGGDSVYLDGPAPVSLAQTGGNAGAGFDFVVGRNASYTLAAGTLSTTGRPVYVGSNPYLTGTVAADAGSTLTQTGGTARLSLQGATGALIVNANPSGAPALYAMSGGLLLSPNHAPITIGDTAAGTFAQTGGSVGSDGTATSYAPSVVTLGRSAGSTGTYSLSGTGSLTTGGLAVGGAAGGVGSFVQTGGSVTATSSVTVSNNGSLTLAGPGNPSLDTPFLDDTGTVTQSAGQLHATKFYVRSGVAPYSLSGGSVSSTELDVLGPNGAYLAQTGGSVSALSLLVGRNGAYSLSAGSLNAHTLSVTNDIWPGSDNTFSRNQYAVLTQTGGLAVTTALTVAASCVYDLRGGSLFANTVVNDGTFFTLPAGAFSMTGPNPAFTNNGSATLDGTQSWPAGSTFSNTLVAFFHSDPGSPSAATLNVTSASPDWAPVVFDAPATHLASLALSSATHASLPAATGTGRLLSTRSLSITDTAQLDLANNTLLLDYGTSPSPADTVRNYLFNSHLASSMADPTHRLGYLDSATFSGEPTAPSSLLVHLTLAGDANFDGVLNADDYTLLDRAYAKAMTNAHWTDGDFNYDGQITSADYLLIDSTYGQSHGLSPSLLATRESQFGDTYVSTLLASVPEPTSLFAACGLTLPLLTRRRTKS